MAGDFDPYYKWLAIPPGEQPPSHYRLLGVPEFEPDADVISSAADRQMAHIRSYSSGPYSALSQKLLNELSAARICLLNAQRRADYDVKLRAQRAAESAKIESAQDAAASTTPSMPVNPRAAGLRSSAPTPRPADNPRGLDIPATTRPDHIVTPTNGDELDFEVEAPLAPVEIEGLAPLESLWDAPANTPSPTPTHQTPPREALDPSRAGHATSAFEAAPQSGRTSTRWKGQPAPGTISPAASDAHTTPRETTAAEPLAGPARVPAPTTDFLNDLIELEARQGEASSAPRERLFSTPMLARTLAGFTAAVVFIHFGLGTPLIGLALALVGGAIVTVGFRPHLLPRRSEAGRLVQMFGTPAIALAIGVMLVVPLGYAIGNRLDWFSGASSAWTTVQTIAYASVAAGVLLLFFTLAKLVQSWSEQFGFFRAAAFAFVCVALLLSLSGKLVSQSLAQARDWVAEAIAPNVVSSYRAATAQGDDSAQPATDRHQAAVTPPGTDAGPGTEADGTTPDQVKVEPSETGPGDSRSPQTGHVPWNVQPERFEPRWGSVPRGNLDLGCKLSEVRRVVFNSDGRNQALALCVVKGTGDATHARLDRFDMMQQQRIQRVDLGPFEIPGSPQLAAASPDCRRVLMVGDNQADLIDLEDPKRLATWFFTIPAGRFRWGALAGDDAILLDSQFRLSAWSTAQGNSARELYSRDKTLCAAVSPSGKYLAAFERPAADVQGSIYDAQTGELHGRLTSLETLRGFSPEACVYSANGEQLAAVGKGRLAVWQLSDGQLLYDFSPLAGSKYLRFLRAGGLFCDGRVFNTNGKTLAGEFQYLSADADWGKVSGTIDGRAWVVASFAPGSPAVLAGLDASAAGDPPTNVEQYLFGGGAAKKTADDFTRSPDQRNKVRVTDASPAEASVEFAQRYYLGIIGGDNKRLDLNAKWLSAGQRPAFGLRWGVGVYVKGQAEQPNIGPAELETLTGFVGTSLIESLTLRVESGKFGDWPQADGGRVDSVVFLGSGKPADLRERAKQFGLDALMEIDLERIALGGGNFRGSMQVKLNMIANDTLDVPEVVARWKPWISGKLGEDAVARDRQNGKLFVEQIMAQVDSQFVLQSLPTVSRDALRQRIEQLGKRRAGPGGSKALDHLEALQAVTELRYYQVFHAADPQTLIPLYDRLLGPGKGAAIAGTDPAARTAAARGPLAKD